MQKKDKNPRMVKAAKERWAAQHGKTSTAKTIETAPSVGAERQAVLPPASQVDYQSIFIAPPAPVNGVFYNPDEAFLQNPENASRMIQDAEIAADLQERVFASAAFPWSIVPQDDEDPPQIEAAECIENIIRSHMPSLADFFLNLLMAIWFGRMGATIQYGWDYSTGERRMVPNGWTPVHGDTIVFADDGSIGYKVGVPDPSQAKNMKVGVIGQYIPVSEEGLKSGEEYLQGPERKAWVVHHYRKTAGEYRLFTSAAAKFGLGLRSIIYPTWVMKLSSLQFYMDAAEKFGSGWVMGWFDGGNPKSAEAMHKALQKQVGSCTMLLPRFAPENEAVEGVDVIDSPTGGFSSLKDIIDYFDKQIRKLICGETMTAENENGSGLGSSMAEIQQNTFGRLIKYDSASLGETLTDQLVSVLQEFNGYGDLPPLRFEFSYDIGTTKEKIENASLLFAMGARFDMTELVQECGFTPLKDAPINTEVTEKGEVIDTTGRVNDEDDEDSQPESLFAVLFDEKKHPRGKGEHGGEFVSKNGGGGASQKKPSGNARGKSNASGDRTSGVDEKERPAAKKKVLRTKPPKMNEKAARAKAAHVMIGANEQQEADEKERSFARSVDGLSFKDSEPVDVVLSDGSGSVTDGIEYKYMLKNGNNKITMDKYAQVRKIEWEKKNKAVMHTIVQSKDGRTFYRRGIGSFRVAGMYEVKGGKKEFKKLIAMEDDELPESARRSDSALRVGTWKPIDGERGYLNTKTGDYARPKK